MDPTPVHTTLPPPSRKTTLAPVATTMEAARILGWACRHNDGGGQDTPSELAVAPQLEESPARRCPLSLSAH
jgi:hypothetical protein